VQRVNSASASTPQFNCLECEYCERSCLARQDELAYEMMESITPQACQAYMIDPVACEGCGVCVRFCPVSAIDFPQRRCGEWMISDTRLGTLVHARLGVAAENSGKLVSTVRREARRIAEEQGHSTIIVDGPPGIGCPVIASLTGASIVLVLTEPTVSGEHDMERVLALAKHFRIHATVCVNKWDINEAMTERIEARARNSGASIVGRIRYDTGVTHAMLQGRAVVETGASSAQDIRNIWNRLEMERD
jgi:MinD superfamily P-loop ATPase